VHERRTQIHEQATRRSKLAKQLEAGERRCGVAMSEAEPWRHGDDRRADLDDEETATTTRGNAAVKERTRDGGSVDVVNLTLQA